MTTSSSNSAPRASFQEPKFQAHFLTASSSVLKADSFGRYHHHHDSTSILSSIGPRMVHSSLNDILASSHRLFLSSVQQKHNLACHDCTVVQAQGPVHGRLGSGFDVRSAKHDAVGCVSWNLP